MRPPTLCHLLQKRFAESPQRVAYTFDSEVGYSDSNGSTKDATTRTTNQPQLTDHDVVVQAIRLAERIRSETQQGERALLVFPPGLEFIIAFYACILARVLAVPVNYPRANRVSDRMRAVVSDCDPSLVLTTKAAQEMMGRSLDEFPDSLRWLTVDLEPASKANLAFSGNGNDASHSESSINASRIDFPTEWIEQVVGDDVAFLQYTSGSTCEPKGVVVSHGNLMHNLSVIESGFRPEDFDHDCGERTGVFWLPAYHDMGLIGAILMPFYAGWRSVLMPPSSFLRRPDHWLRLISFHKAMLSGAPNFALDLCVDRISGQQLEALDLSCLRLLFCGAEPIRAESIQRFENKFASVGFRSDVWYPCYGLAESTLMASGPSSSQPVRTIELSRSKLLKNQIEPVAATKTNADASTTFVGCGVPHGGQQIAIVDVETRRRQSDLHLGEIWVSGESVTQGYWNRPEETRESYGAILESESDSRWLRTGDMGFVRDEELYVTGRIKDLIIIRGQNHYPQDIEKVVGSSHEAVLDHGAAAFGIETDEGERLVVVQEVDRQKRTCDLDQVMSTIRREIAGHFELDVHAIALIRQASLPRTTSGKVQRRVCRQKFLERDLVELARWESTHKSSSGVETIDSTVRADLAKQFIEAGATQGLAKEVEGWLVDWIQKRCNEPRIEINGDTPFTDTGLDSISALELSFELEQWLQVEISPILAWNQPTPSTLAHHIAESAVESAQSQTN